MVIMRKHMNLKIKIILHSYFRNPLQLQIEILICTFWNNSWISVLRRLRGADWLTTHTLNACRSFPSFALGKSLAGCLIKSELPAAQAGMNLRNTSGSSQFLLNQELSVLCHRLERWRCSRWLRSDLFLPNVVHLAGFMIDCSSKSRESVFGGILLGDQNIWLFQQFETTF